MRSLNRTIRVGLTVGIFFFGWYMRDFFYQGDNPDGWHFKIFSVNHWVYLWNQFKSGWVIKTSSDWIFFMAVVLMIPVFCLLWWGAVKISWRKSFMIVFRTIKSWFTPKVTAETVQKKIKIKSKASHKKVRPRPMNQALRPATKQTGRTMDAGSAVSSAPKQPAFVQEQDEPEFNPNEMAPANVDLTQTPAFMNEEISNIPLEDIKLPEQPRLEENLTEVLIAANYQVVKDVQLGEVPVDYVGVSAKNVVLCLTDKEKGDWLADEEFFNGEEPLWFSENAHRISPIYRLLTEAKTFAKKMADKGLTQTVIPILIEKEGVIINAGDMAEVWKKMSVVVCRTDLGGPEELPSFGGALPVADDKGSEADLNMVRSLF